MKRDMLRVMGVGAGVWLGRMAVAGVLAVSSPMAAAQPSVTLAEREFAAGSVLTSVGGWGNVGSMDLTPRSSGGNPGGWTEVRILVAGGTPPAPFGGGSSTFGMVFLAGRTINPAALGGIATVDVSVDGQFVAASASGCGCSVQTALLRQNGVVYAASLPNTTLSWSAISRSGLRATDFGRVVFQSPVIIDSTQNPDFGPGAAPLEVGVSRGNSNGPGPSYLSYFATTGLDNLVFTARGCLVISTQPTPVSACPGELGSLTVEAAGVGTLTYRWQWRAPGGDFVDIVDGLNSQPGGGPIRFSASGARTRTVTVATGGGGGGGGTAGSHWEKRCIVSNACGTVTSDPVRFSVAAPCSLADVCPIGGPAPGACPDGLLTGDDFNAFIGAFAAGEVLADVVGIGGLPPGDGLITGDDFNAFIAAFASGCP